MSQHHDPVHPDSDHLTPELLADLDEGLLDAQSAAHAQTHLAHCEQCRTLRSTLQDVTVALSDLPDITMPDDVWLSLKESLERAPKGASTVVPLSAAPSRRAGWAGRALGGVAIAAGVLFVGALIVPNLISTSSNDAGTAAGDSAENEAADQNQPIDGAKYDVTRSGMQYQSARLDSQVTELVAARSAAPSVSDGATPDGSSTPSSESAAPTGSTTDLATGRTSLLFSADAARLCLESYLLAPADLEPLAIDIGLWKGQRAAIVVLPVAGDATQLEVWVIDPSCADNPEGAVDMWHYEKVDVP